MRVFFIISGNTMNVFVKEQAAELSVLGVEAIFFPILGKGVSGYLSSLNYLKKMIRLHHPAIVHAHYGLSGVLANLQRLVPVITTYHGCDINRLALRCWSSIPLVLSRKNIFVSQAMQQKIHWLNKKTHFVIPMGVNTHTFYEMDQKVARKQLNLDPDKTYVLFSSDFQFQLKIMSLQLQQSPCWKKMLNCWNSKDIPGNKSIF
jgi:teichuronic acid biosynthesis glycosyltransferase TuaC